jgi:hypothetical protein
MQIRPRRLIRIVPALLMVAACSGPSGPQAGTPRSATPTAQQGAPAALEMGGAKSVTRFFVTSRGMGRGGDLGGLTGADAHCQALAKAEGSGDHTWRAYLSTTATPTTGAVNARARIGTGPWYNALGDRVAADIGDLHSGPNTIHSENALTERGDTVSSDAAILTGSRPDGTAFPSGQDLACANWTSSRGSHAQLGAVNRQGGNTASWNSTHASRGCSQQDLGGTGGALLYCFAID